MDVKDSQDPQEANSSPDKKLRSDSLTRMPLLRGFVRRNSATKDLKDLRGSREEESSSSHSGSPTNASSYGTSPHSPGRGLFSPRVSRRSHSDFQEGEPLFSVRAERAMESEGYLSVKKGGVIRFLYTKAPSSDAWMVMHEQQKGLILASDINFTIHASNIYLEAVDDPELLQMLLLSRDPDFEKISDQLVLLLGARNLLSSVLECYCILEQESELRKAIFYREDDTLACQIIRALFRADETLEKFKENFIVFLYKTIGECTKGNRQKPVVELVQFPQIIDKCLDYLRKQLTKNNIPISIRIVLHSIKKVSEDKMITLPQYAHMLSAIFFLRVVCAAACTESEDVRKIAKILLMVGDHLAPDASSEFYPIANKMETLWEKSDALLADIASLKLRWMPQHSVEKEAADFYYLLLRKFSEPEALQSLQSMKKRLGEEKDSAIIQARISRISQFIEDSLLMQAQTKRFGV